MWTLDPNTMRGWKVVCLVTFVSVLVQTTDIYADFDGKSGDYCTTKTNVPGTCLFVSQCAAALAGIRRGKMPKDICGFEGTKSLVCCTGSSDSEEITTKKQTTTKSTTTTTKPTTTTTKPTTTQATSTTVQVLGPKPNTPGYKSREMCIKYSSYAWETKEVPTLSVLPSFTTTLECAFEKEKLIIGGQAASRKEFPHMAQIGYILGGETRYLCGGSLISEKFVLTAGHCLPNATVSTVIRVGITNKTDLIYAQIRNVADVIPHPSYTNKYHDIGLMRVATPFDMNPFVRPACLFTQKSIPFEKGLASGWGRIGFAGEESDTLLKVVLEFFSVASCNKTYRNQMDSELKDGIRDDIMICAGASKEIKDTCEGDSGGPLQIYHDERELKCMYDIVGVTSFGKLCGITVNLPAVYTRVSAYIPWIEGIVWG